MKVLVISHSVYKALLSLLHGYQDTNMPPTDYLRLCEHQLPTQEYECESLMKMFLSLIQQKPLLTDITDYFHCLGKRRDYSDQNTLIVLCYILINVLNESNKSVIVKILEEEISSKMIHLLQMLHKKSISQDIFLAGCKYFEEDYLKDISLKIKGNRKLLSELLRDLKQSSTQNMVGVQKVLTQPISPKWTCLPRLPPPPPTNIPQEFKLPPPKPVPESTYRNLSSPELLRLIKRNRGSSTTIKTTEKVLKNLFQQRVEQRCPIDAKAKSFHQFSSKNDIPVKKNATTVLREASRVIKEEEEEIKKVNALLSGAANYTKYEEWLQQVRIEDERKKLDDIERKHLQGLLSREEAIIARQTLLNTNKEKRAYFDQEKKETEKVLKNMRDKDNEKLKEIIETIHNSRKNINEKKQNIISEKHKKAQEVAELNRQLYEKALSQKKEELEKRIEIIKEIKALADIKTLQSEKFDPTETMNLGFMCEMSLAELQERLQINKAVFKEDLKKRQNCIRKQRQKQQEFLVETEKFIEFCRQQKKTLNNNKKRAENTRLNTDSTSADISELRQKLQDARTRRLNIKN